MRYIRITYKTIDENDLHPHKWASNPQYFDYKVKKKKQFYQYFVNNFFEKYNNNKYKKGKPPEPEFPCDFEKYIDNCVYHYLSKNNIDPKDLDSKIIKKIFGEYSFFHAEDGVFYEYNIEILKLKKFKDLSNIK